MMRLALLLIGSIATALAVAGALLPGLPTTPFLLVALWAFARSSDRLYTWLQRVPLLQAALVEAHRFEHKRAIRPAVKSFALAMAWGSVAFTALTVGRTHPVILSLVTLAAIAGTIFILWVPTDRT
ncbi:MAG: YbaN family protein [Hyphomicrobium sp.]